MKVLIISLYHPELVRGGSQMMAQELFVGLREAGVEATWLASVDPQTSPQLYKSGARITGFDGRPGEFLFLSQDYDYVWEKVSNERLIESFAEFLIAVRPDIIHFQHFMTFGIDFLTLARRTLPEAKIVFTAHEFLTICAAEGHMVRWTDQSLCERASPVRCAQCRPERGPEHYFMREMWFKTHLAVVDVFTVPSQFMILKFVEWGLEESKFRHVANGIAPVAPVAARAGRKNRFGFFGQLIDYKGVHVLLEAVEILRAEGLTDFVVEINGDNLQFASKARREEFEAFREAEAQRETRNVVFNGSYHPADVGKRMGRVDWVVVPSVWWEVFGLVVSEASAVGRPVIASNVGGPAERIVDGENGLLFDVTDARALAAVMRRAGEEDGLWERLAAGISPPAGRAEMVAGYLEVYQQR